MPRTRWFADWTERQLRGDDDCPSGVVQLPRQQYGDVEGLPRFLLVRRDEGAPPIVGAVGWWGDDALTAGEAVRVSRDDLRRIRKGGPKAPAPQAELRAGGWRHLVRHRGDFRRRALIALTSGVATIVAIVAELVTSSTPLWLFVAAVAATCLATVLRTVHEVAAAARV